MDRFSPPPDDLAACQALLRQQAQQLEAQASEVDALARPLEAQARQREAQSRQLEAQLRQLDAQQHTIESHALTIDELERQKQELKRKHDELQLAYNELLRRALQRRSERYLDDPDQLKLDFGNTPAAADAAAGLAEAVQQSRGEIVIEQTIPEHTRRRRLQPRPEGLPQHLPRYEVEAPVPEEMQQCPQHGPRKLIGPVLCGHAQANTGGWRRWSSRSPSCACG